MMTPASRLRSMCLVGLHEWTQSRPLNVVDIFPPPGFRYENPARCCARCGKRQSWLPGAAGSEIGRWCPDQDLDLGAAKPEARR